MAECDNSKIHVSSNSLLSICLLIMLDTLLLVPTLHCNTSLHFTTLHQTTLHYTYRHFTFYHLHFTLHATFPVYLIRHVLKNLIRFGWEYKHYRFSLYSFSHSKVNSFLLRQNGFIIIHSHTSLAYVKEQVSQLL